jgi:aerobic-type carbon monoxide dehydrogenase small subunit (CoxS/CutS family)
MSKLSRRQFVEGTSASVITVGAAAGALAVDTPEVQAAELAALGNNLAPAPASRTRVKFTLNGTEQSVEVEDHWTLVELLRDHLEMTGTKLGCDRSECGACTVLVDGKPMYSCTQLAAWMEGRAIITVEGLAKNGKLDPLQEAFISHDAPQCGYCTSGQLMSAKALLLQNPKPTRDEIRAAMTGNLCRCSNYNHYVEAVMAASDSGPQSVYAGDKA